MKSKINDLKNQILISNGIYEKVAHSEGESYESTELSEDGKYYKKAPIALSEPEIDNLVKYKTIEYLQSLDEKLKTIKGITMFWLVLTIIQLVLSFIGFLLFKNALTF